MHKLHLSYPEAAFKTHPSMDKNIRSDAKEHGGIVTITGCAKGRRNIWVTFKMLAQCEAFKATLVDRKATFEVAVY